MAVGVDPSALVEQHSAVAAFSAANEEHEVVARGKRAYVGHAVCHLSANGVIALECCRGRDMCLNVFYDTVELVERLCSLRIQIYVALEIQALHVIEMVDYTSLAAGLTYESEHLGMTGFAKDNNLSIGSLIIFALYPALQLQHNGACGIYYLDIVLSGKGVSLRRFAVGAQQYFHVVELRHLVVVNSNESHLLQAFTLHSVVHDVAQAIKGIAAGKFFFRLADSRSYTEAKATATVDFYFGLHYFYFLWEFWEIWEIWEFWEFWGIWEI